MLNYSAPFEFLFKDKDWLRKFAIASLLTYTIVGAIPVVGWMIEIVRQVAKGEEPTIPELEDWKQYWSIGGRFTLVNAIWLLPSLLVLILVDLPLIFASSLTGGTLLVIFGGVLCGALAFLAIYSIIYFYLLPAMMVVLAKGGTAWEAMNPVHLWQAARLHFIEYLVVFLIVWVALSNIAVLLSALTLFLLLPPVLVYVGLVAAHYAGQLGYLEEHESGEATA